MRKGLYTLRIATSGVLGGLRGYTPYTNLRVFLDSVIINKQGTFRPFATPLCVYPPPFLAIHHWSQPLAQSYIRYLDETRASCPKTPCRPKCMTKSPRHPHHIACSSRLNFPQSPDVLMLTTLNLFVYASLWMVQTTCICHSDPTNSQAILQTQSTLCL